MAPKRSILPLVAVAGALAAASPATAAVPTTYCVGKPACSGTPEPDLQAALDAAKSDPGADRAELGAGDFLTASEYTYKATPHNPVAIVGAGADQTRLLTTQDGSVTTLTLGRGSVTDLEVVAPSTGNVADLMVALDLTGRGERLKLTGGWVNVVLGKGAKLMTSTLTGGGLDFDRPAVLVSDGDASLSDSTVDASSTGVRVSDAGILHLTRSTIVARTGVAATDGGGVEIRDSLIRGNDTHSFGIIATAGSDPAGVYATNVTVVGNGDEAGAGVLSKSKGAGVQANVELRNSVVTRAFVPLRREAPAGHAYLKVSHSAFDPSNVVSTGPGEFDAGEGNTAAAPGFVDAPGNDFRPAPGSVLIDAGNPAPDGGLSDVDRDGLPRSVDGNGDGVAAPDIGAFEYQPAGAPGDPPVGTPPAGEVPGAADLTAPFLSSLSLEHRRFRVRKGATAFRFRLSEDARVTIRISRRVKGKRRAAGKLVRTGRAGKNRVRFSGRLGKRALKRGRYVATVRAVDAAGLASRVRSVKFSVLPRLRSN